MGGPREAGTTFKFLTWNARLWGKTATALGEPTFLHFKDDERFPHILDALHRTEADVVALQEVWDKRYIDQLRTGLADKYPHFHAGPVGPGIPGLVEQLDRRLPRFMARRLVRPETIRWITDLITRAHYETLDVGQLAFVARALGAARAALPLEDLWSDAYALPFEHPQMWGSGLVLMSRHELELVEFSPFSERADLEKFANKGVLHGKVRLPTDQRVFVMTGHLQEGHSAAGVRARKRQLNLIRSLKVSHPDMPVAFAGDLNVVGEEGSRASSTLVETAEHRDMLQRLSMADAYRLVYPNPQTHRGATFVHQNPMNQHMGVAEAPHRNHQRIDGILINELLKAVEVALLDELRGEDLSDHAALLGVLELAA